MIYDTEKARQLAARAELEELMLMVLACTAVAVVLALLSAWRVF